MINPVFLRTFMSLVKTNHFTQTAQLLNMTQPGVTQHIKKLEHQVGKALINRFGKKFELTSAGESLLHYGLQLSQAELALKQTIAGDELNAGECKLACSGSMAMQLYPELLKLQRQFCDLRISVEAAPNAAIIERVKTNQADIGIITQSTNDPKLVQERLGEDTLCLALPAQADCTWQSLMQLGFINHPDGHHYAIGVLEMNFKEQFVGMESIPQSGYINQLSQILLPVSLGLGFTVIPKSSLDAFVNPELIGNFKLVTPINETVYLISKKHRILPARYQLIRALICKQWD